MAYAFSLKDMISAVPGYENQCLSMNDYVSIKKRVPVLNEAGDTVVDDAGKPMFYRYGFAGVDLTGSPVVADSKGNYGSNGSIFILEPVDAAEAILAKQEFEAFIDWRHDHNDESLYLYPISYATTTIDGWSNLPALFNETAMTKLSEIKAWLKNFFNDSNDALHAATDYEAREAIGKSIVETVNSKVNEATALVGNGCIVRLRNQLSLKDIDAFINGDQEANEQLQLGNAYIAAGGTPTYKFNNRMYSMDHDNFFDDFAHSGIEPRLEADQNCEWELIPVKNAATFLLYNKANNCYIRKHHDLFTYAGGEKAFGADENSVSEISWMTTPDQKDAASFNFIGCPDENEQYEPTELILGLMENAGLDRGIENKVRLQANYDEYVFNPASGKNDVLHFQGNIHRGSKSSDYRFINWCNTYNNWFADSNAFLIESVEMGSISELAADKPAQATGIYDLQGRRVSNPGKGLYIVNGRKTVIK